MDGSQALDEGAEVPRVDILGVRMAAADPETVLNRFARLIRARATAYVCAADVHLVMRAYDDPEVRDALNGADMTVTDGMPLVWVCRLAGRPARRVYGPDLLLAACARGLGEGWRHYFCGGAEGVAEELARRLAARFPGLQVAGTACPPFAGLSGAAEAELLAEIDRTRPDIVWVGLGAPKQELFMRRTRARLAAPLLVGVGAAFDFHSGSKPQAPRILMGLGLEWLFRLATEPRRLWPRYRKVVPGFLLALAAQAVRRRRV